tara:strand:+ start:258 stop:650 length:393 start_codon:yes stop_codon:yes gene_type:complete
MKLLIFDKELRQFGFLLGFGIPLIMGWIVPFIWGSDFKKWTLVVGLIFLIIASVKPLLLKYPYKFWMRLGLLLGFINSRIVLGLVFILVLFPISLIMKIFGYDPLSTKKKTSISYREIRDNQKIDLNRIF